MGDQQAELGDGRSGNKARSKSNLNERPAGPDRSSTLPMSFSTLCEPAPTKPPAQPPSTTETTATRLAASRNSCNLAASVPCCLGDERAELLGGSVLAVERVEDAVAFHLGERRNPRSDLAHHAAPAAGARAGWRVRELACSTPQMSTFRRWAKPGAGGRRCRTAQLRPGRMPTRGFGQGRLRVAQHSAGQPPWSAGRPRAPRCRRLAA